MTAYWHFYAIPENDIRQFTTSVYDVIPRGDLETWRNLFVHPRHELPALLKSSNTEACEKIFANLSSFANLAVDRLPELADPSLRAMLREIALASAAHHLVSRESKPGHRFAELEIALDDEGEELEYELLLHTIFRAGTTIAKPLDYLSGGDAANVSLVTSKSIANLLRLEEQSQLLRRLSNVLSGRGDVFGLDLEDLLSLMEVAHSKGLSLYYWEPGT